MSHARRFDETINDLVSVAMDLLYEQFGDDGVAALMLEFRLQELERFLHGINTHEDGPESISGPLRQFSTTFDNGYGVSLIVNAASYGMWELAVQHGKRLCYATPITSDVNRYETIDEMMMDIRAVAHLPPDERCSHNHPMMQDDD